jgi:hypothetical protein
MLLLVLAALTSPPLEDLSDDSALFELRRRVDKEPRAAIPESRLPAPPDGAPESCRLFRMGQPALELQLRFTRAAGGARRDGFAVDVMAQGGSSPVPPLWYSRGRLLGTLTLPPPVGSRQERPGTREEYVVFTYLPATRELLAEWQRQAGPHPPKDSDLDRLPQAILVEKGIVYSSYLRASAYMSCRPRAAPLPDGSSRTSPAPGGTRHPAP